MKMDEINLTKILDNIPTPSRPHRTEGQETVTKEELKRRIEIAEELENLGISTTKFNAKDGHEDADIMRAIILINQGKKIPDKLRKKVLIKNGKSRGNTGLKKEHKI